MSDSSAPQSSESSTLEFAEFEYITRRSLLSMLRIVKYAKDVFIDKEQVKENATLIFRDCLQSTTTGKKYNKVKYHPVRCTEYFYPAGNDNRTVDWLFVLNALNFSLWDPTSIRQWTVHGYTGYVALSWAIKRAIDEGRPMWDPNYYSELEQIEVEIIFRGDNKKVGIPLIHERVKTLHEIGKVLLDNYEGSFANCIKICDGDALKLRHLLFSKFTSYRDKVNFEGEEVYIGCKIATLIADLSNLRKISGDTHSISTIFVDYCAPQALLKLGILRYSDDLNTRFMESGEPLAHGSREDLEIRSCSLVACRMLCYDVVNMYKQYTKNKKLIEKLKSDISIIIDNFLWCYRLLMGEDILFYDLPFHNIRSVYY